MICQMCQQEFHGYNKNRKFCDTCLSERRLERARDYYQRNRERLIAYHKAYYAAHKEECRAYNKKYRETHRDEINLKKKVMRITGEYRLPRV